MASRTKPVTSGLSIALVGTRGVPANYGGFETAVEEVGRRLADRGHRVYAYGRGESDVGDIYSGIRRITLPAIRTKALETLSHTAFSTLHVLTRTRPDIAFVFNAANSPFLPMLRLAKIPVALHVDGLEWKRSKWGTFGRGYYRRAEEFGVRTADALIADSVGIASYYMHQFGAKTELIKYGAPVLSNLDHDGIARLGLHPRDYHLVVARFEPENHVYEIVEGYLQSTATKPLVVVGSAPYAERYTKAIQELARSDKRVHLLGAIYDQELLDELYFHSYTYLHGHSVGGTNPSLLRAIGAGTAVIAYDVSFNRDVLANHGWFFSSSVGAGHSIQVAELAPGSVREYGEVGQRIAAEQFTWEAVADQYEALAQRLAQGDSRHAQHARARRNKADWPMSG